MAPVGYLPTGLNGVFTLDAGARIAHAAAEQLSDRSVEVKVIDMRSLIPLDSGTILQSVRKTSRAVVIDIALRAFGIIKEIDVLDGKEAFDPSMRRSCILVRLRFRCRSRRR